MKKLTKKQKLSRNSALTLAALGVVYGDIGTSPIYAFNEAVRAGGDTPAEILGVLSLVFWTLTAVVSVKYLVFVLHADNRGEGGTLAMFSQLSSKIRNGRKGMLGFTVFVFLMAAAMEFSDGILTPAISVISAVEGIKTINPELEVLVVPITVVILAALFIFQFKGTHRLGKVFGPVMVVWFLTISVIGISQIAQNPASLVAQPPPPGPRFEHTSKPPHRGERTLNSVNQTLATAFSWTRPAVPLRANSTRFETRGTVPTRCSREWADRFRLSLSWRHSSPKPRFS